MISFSTLLLCSLSLISAPAEQGQPAPAEPGQPAPEGSSDANQAEPDSGLAPSGESSSDDAIAVTPAEPEPTAEIRNPEQVQAEVQAAGGDPFAPPNPHARPSEGVYAVGSSGVAPLPEPPPPVPVSSIPKGDWRGMAWLSLNLGVSGPIAGLTPARSTVIGMGAGVDVGWRARQWLGVGTRFTTQPHEVFREQTAYDGVVTRRGYLTVWDVAFVRLWAPVRGRVEPYIDAGGGMAFLDPARLDSIVVGGTARAAVGFDAWVGRNLSLGLAGIYRATFMDKEVGHAWRAAFDLTVHW
ncbi:MAG: hypothetical protein KC457_25030 [Myxococcales bacterium]|nr:hypothetical protein [Myxococcales bacterium]